MLPADPARADAVWQIEQSFVSIGPTQRLFFVSKFGNIAGFKASETFEECCLARAIWPNRAENLDSTTRKLT
jgi:hypothetical protein